MNKVKTIKVRGKAAAKMKKMAEAKSAKLRAFKHSKPKDLSQLSPIG